MKFKIIIFALLIVFSFSSLLLAQESPAEEMFFTLFDKNYENIEELFTDSFLQQVPAANIEQILNSYSSQLGKLREVEQTQDGYSLIFENGSAPSQITLNDQGKVAGLWFGSISLSQDNFEEILNDFKKLDGEVSVYVDKNNSEELLAYNENKDLAVGSTFKLYVLKALYEEIETTEKTWEDIIKLEEKNMTLPSGILQNWSIDSPLTVKSLANLMISLSDNTATDHLIDYVGRKNIEKLVDDRNKPFIKASEMFKLKYGIDDDKVNQFLNSNFEEKRNILANLNDISVSRNDISGSPRLIDSIEWFFTTEELAKTIYDLKDAEELRINSGLASKDNWYLAGYKGGSETGVIQFTHIIQKSPDSDIYTVSVTVNNQNGVDNNKVQELVTRLISVIDNLN
ncbi:MAG: serine hydrolase [Bacillota bacterium]